MSIFSEMLNFISDIGSETIWLLFLLLFNDISVASSLGVFAYILFSNQWEIEKVGKSVKLLLDKIY